MSPLKYKVLTVCPWNDLIGLSLLNLHTCIHWSVLHDAKLLFVCQSTSRAGAEWKENCCVHCPLAASHIIVVCNHTNFSISYKIQLLVFSTTLTVTWFYISTWLYYRVSQKSLDQETENLQTQSSHFWDLVYNYICLLFLSSLVDDANL